METFPDKCTRNVYDEVIPCEAPSPNLKTANISGNMVVIYTTYN